MDGWRLSTHASHFPARYGGGWRQCKPTRCPVISSRTLDLASRDVLRGRAVVAAAEPVHVDSRAPRHWRSYRPCCHRSAAAMGLMTLSLSLTMAPCHQSTLQLRQPLPPLSSLNPPYPFMSPSHEPRLATTLFLTHFTTSPADKRRLIYPICFPSWFALDDPPLWRSFSSSPTVHRCQRLPRTSLHWPNACAAPRLISFSVFNSPMVRPPCGEAHLGRLLIGF